jgi:uncharacterized protein
MEIEGNVFKVIVKPNSKTNEIVSFDDQKKAYIIKIKARAEDNKANIELIRFLSKVTGKKAEIRSGLKSREKIIKMHDS